MSLTLVARPGIYQDSRTGNFFERPIINGRRTARKLHAQTLRQAKKLKRQLDAARLIKRGEISAQKILNQPAVNFDGLPPCLAKYSNIVEVIIPPRAQRGIYFLMDGNECIYVGQSKHNVHIRLAAHRLNKQFTKAFYIPMVDGDLHTAERHFIAVLKPKFNSLNINAAVEDPFAGESVRRSRVKRNIEVYVRASMRLGEDEATARRKAKILFRDRTFDPSLVLVENEWTQQLRQQSCDGR